ncbi:SusC/RagA family TonB-linked outer membrane protein [Flavivirga spongiicola]|uniref:TonB-dependent receptor n=1 Tax=Flavivirga spongiicola TaxID=421621 RepID=A0ABU7XRF5_9FLAO|nr:TonB-dependent receptor [Flavivirga sp. MEBiC05379]MDO5978367.1 TonB-dependent receptor [Flavivirga sp. MEBiC05379]
MEFKFKSAFLYFKEKLLIIMMRTLILLCCTVTFGFSPNSGLSQNAKIVIDTDITMSVEQIFELIKTQTDYKFIYRSDVIQNAPSVQLEKGIVKAGELLNKVLSPISCTFEFTENNTVIVQRKSNIDLIPQENVIKGTITDEANVPIAGATIMIKGTSRGVASDFDGGYQIKIPSQSQNAVLIFSYVGFLKQEINVGSQSKIDIQMKPDISGLDEVVVVGYGTSKKKFVTGAISTLSKEVLETNTFPTIGSMIQGQLPGVYVVSGSGVPGSSVRIRIRGDATLNSGADPLIVINGVPMPDEFDINDISPNDISALDVLKGASASAIYGSRALAGVIQITTKRGTKYTKPVISYSVTTSTKALGDKVNQLNAEDFRTLHAEGVLNYMRSRRGIRGAGSDQYATDAEVRAWDGSQFDYDYYLDRADIQDHHTDWLDLLLGNGNTTTHNLSMRGGDENMQYSFSYNDHTEEGIVVGTKFKRNTLSLNFDNRFSDKVKMGFSILGGTNSRKNGDATIRTATNMRPDLKAFNDDGSYFIDFYERTFGPPWAQTTILRARDNPLVLAKEVKNDNLGRNVNLTPYIEINPFKDLTFRSQYSYYVATTEGYQYHPSFTDRSLLQFRSLTTDGGGLLTTRESEVTSKIFTNYLSYLKEINEHDISATLGMEWNKRISSSEASVYEGFPDDYILNTPGDATEFVGSAYNEQQTSSIGYFARANYQYKKRYLLEASGRIDGSSRFGVNNQYAFFPSISAGYIVSSEPFFEGIKNTLNLFKLRVSYGKSGNDRVGAYEHLARVGSASAYLNNPTSRITSLANPDLKWETSTEYNFGLDFGFMKGNKIRGSIDVYNKDVDDMLLSRSLPPSTSSDIISSNIGAINNKGIEIGLSAVIVQNEKLTFDLGANISKNKNKLVSFGDRERGSSLSNPSSTVIGNLVYEVGQPLGQIFGFQTDGLFQSYDEIDEIEAIDPDTRYQESFYNTIPGHIKFVDNTGDGRVTQKRSWNDDPEDRVVIGSTQPDYTGGVYMNFEYEGFRLNVRSTFQIGGDKYWAYGEDQFGTVNTDPSNRDAIALQRWTPNNPNAKYPAFMNQYFTNKLNDFWLYDASHFRIQEIVLSYDLSKKVLEKTNFIKRFTLFGSVNNVVTFTKYPGYGLGEFGFVPNGSGSSPSSTIGTVYDNSSYPQERTFRFGVRIDF